MANITYDTSVFLGQGPHFTRVYKGNFDGREVAVKVVPNTELKNYNILQDIDTLKKSDFYDHIVRYFGCKEKDETTLIALELCDTNLQKWVEAPQDRILCPDFSPVEILRQLTSGVAHLHSNNPRIVHRNLKPENVLLRSHPTDGIRVKICDFGFSKSLPKNCSNHSSTVFDKMSKGYETTAWMAPEVLNCEKLASQELTKATDVFSLGCLYYFVLTDGKHPFHSGMKIEIPGNIIHDVTNIKAEDFKNAHPENLELIKAMINSDPGRRPKILEILSHRIFDSCPTPGNTNRAFTRFNDIGDENSGNQSTSTGTQDFESQDLIDATPKSSDGEDEVDMAANTEPLTVKVIRPVVPMDFKDDVYRLPAKEKGYAFILNIIEFDDPRYYQRTGALNDTRYMSDLCTQLGYTVFPKDEAVRSRGRWIAEAPKYNIEEFDNFKKQCLEDKPKSIVVFIGSHGGYNKVYTSNSKILNLYEKFVNELNDTTGLRATPKIFFVNTCQDFDRTEYDDGTPVVPVDHTIVVQSQVPGHKSNRDTHRGSWFTYCLTDVFMKKAHKAPLIDLLEEVREKLKSVKAEEKVTVGQLCPIGDLGLKKLYFNMDPE